MEPVSVASCDPTRRYCRLCVRRGCSRRATPQSTNHFANHITNHFDPARSASRRIGKSTLRRQHATPNLIQLNRFEQRFEITFTKALITFALDDLEEDWAEQVLREDLQQHA